MVNNQSASNVHYVKGFELKVRLLIVTELVKTIVFNTFKDVFDASTLVFAG